MFSSKKKSSSLEMTDEAHYWLICAYTFLTAEMYRRLCFLSLKMKGSDSAHLQTRKRFLPFASSCRKSKRFSEKAHVHPMIPSRQSNPDCISFIMPSDTWRRDEFVCVYWCSILLEQVQGPNKQLLLCPEYLVCMNFNADDLSSLHSVGVLWIITIVS